MQQNSMYCHLYFYVAFGHHLATLIYILKSPCLPDFFDQLLPCVAALCLIYFSYMSNFLRVGVVILFCHDICDIFTFGCVLGRKISWLPLTIIGALVVYYVVVFWWIQCGVSAQVQGVCRHAVSQSYCWTFFVANELLVLLPAVHLPIGRPFPHI